MRKQTKFKVILFLSISTISLFSLLVITPISAVREDIAWFYDNLSPEQRLHIRKAIDYAIPRDKIIDTVLQGMGTKIASPVEANDGAYDPTIVAREFDLTKALDHMEAAFGYRYNDSADNAEDRLGYFSMTILCPTSRDDRMEWAALTTKTLQEIGIDVYLKYANWNIGVPLVFDREEGTQGFDFTHGGYDSFFIGWTGSPESDVSQWFYKENFIPNGTNLGYIDNAEVEEILDRALGSLNLQDRLDAFKEFQQWFKDNLPYYIVLQLNDLWAKDPDLEGVSYGFDYPNYQNWTHATNDLVTVMTPGDFMDMNPLQAGSYYDKLAVGDVFEGLVDRTSKDANTYYGQIAEKWSMSADQLDWVFTVRDGIKWSDGSDLTVDDVIFTYQSYLDPATNCYGAPNLAKFLNAVNVIKINATSVRFIMNKFYAYQISNFALPILQKNQLEALTGPEWKTDPATNSQYAPKGTGPYMMLESETNTAEGHVTLVLNPHYTNTRGDPDWNNPDRIETIKVELYTSAATAVAALKAGALNIIDSNVALQPYVNEIGTSGVAEGWGEIILTLGGGHQGFYINQISPIWGMNPGDPLEMYPEDYIGITKTIPKTTTTTTTTIVTTTAEITPAWSALLVLITLVISEVRRKRE